MKQTELLIRFENALEKLAQEENYLAVQMCKLGYPEITKSVPTAAVTWDEYKKKIKFIFNNEFQELLTDEEFIFVTAHESVHLLNGHVPLLLSKIEEMKRFNKSEQDMKKFQLKFNIAADCVVNDSLVNLYGLKAIMTEETEEKPKAIYGKDIVNMDCHDMTVMDVFYLIDDETMKRFEKYEFQHNWDAFFDENGNVKEGVIKSIKGFVRKNIENSSLSDKDLEKMEKIRKALEKNNIFPKNIGNEPMGAFRAVDNQTRIAINWQKIFVQMTEKRKSENYWSKPNNKLISVYPKIILPNLKFQEKEEILCMIDASGSIDYNALSLFIGIIKNMPKHFIVKTISFDTQIYEFDIQKDEKPRGGGGTRFDILSDYVNGLKKHPKCIIVLTDGAGSEIFPKRPELWNWLLYGEECKTYCGEMKTFSIKGLIL